MRNILGIVASYLFIALIILAAKFFANSGKEASRKFIHIMLANWWFIAMYFFETPVWAAIVPASFVIINYISYKKDIIKVMERDEEEKDGLGTVYYALTLFVLSILTFGILDNPGLGLVSVLIMGYGDGLAAIIGKTIKSYEYKIGNTKKTLAGSLTMLMISFGLISLFLLNNQIPFWHLKAIISAILLTLIEAISIKGTDNLTVPLSACIILKIMMII